MMKLPFAMALRQMIGFVERLLGLTCQVPGFSPLSRRHKKLGVNIPYMGPRGRCCC